MAKVITKRQKFEMLAEVIKSCDSENRELLLDFITKEVETIDKKALKSTETNSKKREENEKIKSEIVKYIGDNTVSCSEIVSVCFNNDYSTQKIVRLISELVNDGIVKKEKVKGYMVYSLIKD